LHVKVHEKKINEFMWLVSKIVDIVSSIVTTITFNSKFFVLKTT
jgi:hypothetical protein